MADEATAYDKHTLLRVNHGKGEYVDGMVHTNSIESYGAVIKRGQMGVYRWWSINIYIAICVSTHIDLTAESRAMLHLLNQ